MCHLELNVEIKKLRLGKGWEKSPWQGWGSRWYLLI